MNKTTLAVNIAIHIGLISLFTTTIFFEADIIVKLLTYFISLIFIVFNFSDSFKE